MINTKKTLETFGYEAVPPYSDKLVVWSCDFCGKDFEKSMRKISDSDGRSCCSRLCTKERRKATNLLKYGVEHVMRSETVQLKTRTTNLERYGVPCAVRAESVQEKVKATNLTRYGQEYAIGSYAVREKIRKTNQERHGGTA